MNNPVQEMAQNPFFQILKFAQGGGDPIQMLQQMASRDPRAAQALNIFRGKNAAELQQVAINMAKERGLDVQEIARSLGLL